MRVSVVGTGHVGLITAVCLAHIGHEVLGVDEDAGRIDAIAAGRPPFFEPGLEELLQEQLTMGRLRVSTDVADAARSREAVFICVGTPTAESGEADLSQVERVARTLAAAIDGYTVVVEKSTVPVGTGAGILRTMREIVRPGIEFDVASNPEFLQEGLAIRDTLEPTRIVVGTDSERATAILRDVYQPVIDRTGCAFIATDMATAELVKHSSNAFLATKISFINQVADICERAGADVEVVAAAMGLDPRIGSEFLKAGLGYGGACFPKDVRAFRHAAGQQGVEFGMLAEVESINLDRRLRFIDKIKAVLGTIEDKRIALWGLAFKRDTDDLRNAPAIEIAQRLSRSGAFVTACDPAAIEASRPLLPLVGFSADPLEAARDADCVAICTDWPEFAAVDLDHLRDVMARPVIVDGRNLIDPEAAEAAGFVYLGTGRPMRTGRAPRPDPPG